MALDRELGFLYGWPLWSVDDDSEDDDNDDDDDDYSCNLFNFQTRNSRFCMIIDLDGTYRWCYQWW